MLESLPAFVKLVTESRNPMLIEGPGQSTLENVTKASWFVVPFYYLAFLGLVPVSKSDSLLLVLLAFATLIAVSWIGVTIGMIAAFRRGLDDAKRDLAMGGWTITLTLNWFFCVVILTVANAYLWFTQDNARWPNIVTELGQRIVDSSLRGTETLIVTIVPAFLGAVFTIVLFGKGRRGSFAQSIVVGSVCFLVSAGLVLFSSHFLDLTAFVQAPAIDQG